jgi:hypothetical protein
MTMETEMIEKQPGNRSGMILIILAILTAAFLIYYSVMSFLSPARTLDRISNEYAVKQDEKTKIDEKIFSDSTFLIRFKEKAFLQSRIALAESDSIYLTINLADSTANLEIYGVVVHSAKIKELKMSNILRKGNDYVISSLFSSPFTISSSIATIRKEPVLISMAPKDTSEYIPDVMPDTSITEPVNYRLEMTDGTRIYIYQEENDISSERRNLFKFDLRDRLSESWNALKRVAVFKVPDYHLFIKIKIPQADAKIIYRALPKNGQIGVFR